MAPLKQQTKVMKTNDNKFRNFSTITTRSRVIGSPSRHVKRKADASPHKAENNTKRSALGEITNNKLIKNTLADHKADNNIRGPVKKAVCSNLNNKTDTLNLNGKKFGASSKVTVKPAVAMVRPNNAGQNLHTRSKQQQQTENIPPPAAPKGVTTRGTKATVVAGQHTAVKPKIEGPSKEVVKVKTRLSNEFEKTEESLYSSALEDLNDSSYVSSGSKKTTTTTTKASSSTPEKSNSDDTTKELCSTKTPPTSISIVSEELNSKLNLGDHNVPEDVDDFDKENWNDPFQVSEYAMDIFNYMKTREEHFEIPDYMSRQICLSTWMRSLLIDWMVEVQESFELNHETLYLGVKLVDTYLSKVTVGKETLQLVGAAAIFIASKFDERIPPLIDDFLYICDGAYARSELIKMEINLLKICNFNLGTPLSYRFLRRFARCGKITMPVLTLARFILEYSLMDYATVTVRDSKIAAACLYLAIKMKKVGEWNSALEFYTGYKLQELASSVVLLNDSLHKKTKAPLKTVRNKYSHKIFFEVAKTPLLANEHLF